MVSWNGIFTGSSLEFVRLILNMIYALYINHKIIMICIQFYVSGKWHDNCGEVNVHCLPSRKPATTNKGNTLKSFNYAPNRPYLILFERFMHVFNSKKKSIIPCVVGVSIVIIIICSSSFCWTMNGGRNKKLLS